MNGISTSSTRFIRFMLIIKFNKLVPAKCIKIGKLVIYLNRYLKYYQELQSGRYG